MDQSLDPSIQDHWIEWKPIRDNKNLTLISAPTAVSWGPDRIDLFAIANDHAVWTREWDPIHKWTEWGSLGTAGGGFQDFSSPAVASWKPDRLDVFAIDGEGFLWTKVWDPSIQSHWIEWKKIVVAGTEPLGSNPAAVSWGPNRIDVFTRAAADPTKTPVGLRTIEHLTWDGDKNEWYKKDLWGPDRAPKP
jgi:hypothetical protein